MLALKGFPKFLLHTKKGWWQGAPTSLVMT